MSKYRDDYLKTYAEDYRKRYRIDLHDSNIEIHHIDHDRDNNSIDNLVALPRGLHKKYHNIYSEMDSVDFSVPREICGNRVCIDTYRISLMKEYLAVLEECAEWMDIKELIDLSKGWGMNYFGNIQKRKDIILDGHEGSE